MEKIARYTQIVRNVLAPMIERKYAGYDMANEAVFDESNDRYVVVTIGFERSVRRMYRVLAQLDIIDGKIWIQCDMTEDGIAYDLQAAGVPKSDIVLAFHPEKVRPDTGYAVA